MNRKFFIVPLILIFSCSMLLSAPLSFVPITLTQPDGTVLNVYASGDEYYNWVHDKDNFTIIKDSKTGYYVYASLLKGKLAATNYIVGKVDPKTVGLAAGVNEFPEISRPMNLAKSIYDSENLNSVMADSRYNLVIFIRFKGETEFTDSKSVYDDMLNGEAGPSLKNYYRETSNGQLDITSYIYPNSNTIISYQDTETRNYYLKYDADSNPIGYQTSQKSARETALLRRALDFAAPQIPSTTNLDGNSDDRIDNVVFIVSGSPAGWSDLLWPHMSSLGGTTYRINNKRVATYNFQLQKSVAWYVLDHEMGHSLGMPDLYRYNNKTITPVGQWELMATNRVHMNNYMKWKYLKWIPDLPEITKDGTYWIYKSTATSKNIYKIKSPRNPKEYFVLEYRVKKGLYENYLPGTGLLVYRINEKVSGNADGPPDEVYLYRPNGTTSVDGQLTQANFGSDLGRTQIDDSTNPSSFLSDGYAGGLKIKNIGTAGGDSISFDVEIVESVVVKNDYIAEKTNYNWIDISKTGTTIKNWMNATAKGDSTLDDGYTSSAIPLGFDFEFYGQNYNSIYVGINGLISFTQKYLNVGVNSSKASPTNFGYFNSNVAWPGNRFFSNSIAVAYADLDLNPKDGYGGGKIMYQSFADKFVLSWLNIGTFEKKTDTTNTFQLVLEKNNGIMFFNYKNFGLADTRLAVKVGIQKDSTNGLSWIDQGDLVERIPLNSSAVKFYPSTLASVKYENEIAANFRLMQNYPNPFNPSTVICYQISVPAHVTLKVFDVLGREVTTLVNEYKQAGKYNVEFRMKNPESKPELLTLASSLSSGIYFYRLAADNFSETKKMILLK